MKALDFLTQLTKENLNIEYGSTVSGKAIIDAGPLGYFGVDIASKDIKNDKNYFYWYGEIDYFFSFMESPNIILPINETECIYIWEIE